MLKGRKLQIAEALLKHLKNKEISTRDMYLRALRLSEREKEFDIEIIGSILMDDLSLIQYLSFRREFIKLTINGRKAAEIGLEKYLDDLERRQNAKEELPRAQLLQIRSSFIFSILAIIVSVVLPIYLNNTKYDLDRIKERDAKAYVQRQIRHYSDSVDAAIELRDSLLIEKFKYSLKHDTMFLNEISNTLRTTP